VPVLCSMTRGAIGARSSNLKILSGGTDVQTRMTELFGIRYPIMQGGMQWVGFAELASAVSNAGGLGTITALSQGSPEGLAKEIRRCRDMTDKPFAVNITILPTITPTPYDEYIQAAVEGDVTIVETAGRNPAPYMTFFKTHAVKVIHKCTSVRHALTAQRIGCDAVSVDGMECAGHPGEDDVTNFVLLPVVANALTIPFLASGGIADGRGLAAALALGADGINMGTRFLATREAPVHEHVKRTMVKATELDTAHILRTLGNTVRVFKNAVAKRVLDIEARPGPTNFDDIKDLVAGATGRQVFETGDTECGIWTAGLALGLIDDIPSCEELITRMVRECRETVKARLMNMVG
jgi:NAD(P)H-dependent flavin oxidoreductase YrpB (nitropropane dioxygenase family)